MFEGFARRSNDVLAETAVDATKFRVPRVKFIHVLVVIFSQETGDSPAAIVSQMTEFVYGNRFFIVLQNIHELVLFIFTFLIRIARVFGLRDLTI